MGETANYEDMLREMEEEKARAVQERLRAAEAEVLEREAAYVRAGTNEFQVGCPFKMKDVVRHDPTKREGKVIGLPFQRDIGHYTTDDHANEAWVHFSDGSRQWCSWGELTELRRSPVREKRPTSGDPAPAAKKTVQQKLFAASRSEFQRAAADMTNDMPAAAEHERDRRMPAKPPVGVRGRAKQGLTTPQSKVPVPQRLIEFPNKGFRDSFGSIFCGPCCAVVPNIKTCLDQHTNTEKHKRNLNAFNARSTKDIRIMTELGQYFRDNPDLAGGTKVSEHDQLFRYRTTEVLMYAGILSKADDLRPLLERSGRASVGVSHLRAYIPRVEANEINTLNGEFTGELMVWIFDSTARVGDLFCMVGRYCTSDFSLQQRLAALHTNAHHMNAVQQTALMSQLIMTKYRSPIMSTVGFARDSVSMNGATMRRLQVNFTSAEDEHCMPHTLCHLGENFELSVLDELMSLWVKLIYSSTQAHDLWADLIEESVVGFSSVRWYALAEIIMQIARKFPLLPVFLAKALAAGIGPVLVPKMRDLYNANTLKLKMQFAAMLDMRVVVSVTYELEGDSLPQMLAYTRCEGLLTLGEHLAENLPNVDAVIRNTMSLSNGVKIAKAWPGHGLCVGHIVAMDRADSTLYPGQERTVYTVQYPVDGEKEDLEEEELRPLLVVSEDAVKAEIVTGLKKGFDYFEARVEGTCDAQYSIKHMYENLRLIQVFDPCFATTNVTQEWVQNLSHIIPLHTHGVIPGMIKELPSYRVLAAQAEGFNRTNVVEYSDALLKWWKVNNPTIPNWAKAARIVFALTCTSAASERVFSLVKSMYGKGRDSALADDLQGSVMLRYNKRLVG